MRVKVNKSNSSNRTVLGNDDDDEGGDTSISIRGLEAETSKWL